MKRTRLQNLAAALACLGMLMPHVALANPALANSAVGHGSDVALHDGGVLVGQVVGIDGAALPGAPVAIFYGEHEIARTVSDENGVFAARGLRGGQYTIATGGGQSTYRLWAANTAPPTAQPAVLLTQGGDAVRGQWGGYGYAPGKTWLNWMRAHPYITAGVIAAAIAIPLAIADDDWQPSS